MVTNMSEDFFNLKAKPFKPKAGAATPLNSKAALGMAFTPKSEPTASTRASPAGEEG